MAEDSKGGTNPGIWIILALIIFVPAFFNAIARVISSMGYALEMQSMKNPGFVIILIIIIIFAFKKKSKD